jgi:xanthine dehydrogenase accessory factor
METPASEWIRGLDRFLGEHPAACLVTVLDVHGSAPRGAGAKMVVAPDGSIAGTIGGGALEQEAQRIARQSIADALAGEGDAALREERWRLCPRVHQCCGGTVKLLFEVVRAPHPVAIFGAGHVAAELCDILRGMDFSLTVADPRGDWNTPERFPSARRITGDPVAFAATLERGYALVMTHDHEVDFALLAVLLERPLAFTGLIGSATKRRTALARLGPERSARLVSPIGIDIGGKTPREIAIAVAAQLIARRNGIELYHPKAERAAPTGSEP